MCGAAFALGASLRKASDKTYLIAPKSVKVASTQESNDGGRYRVWRQKISEKPGAHCRFTARCALFRFLDPAERRWPRRLPGKKGRSLSFGGYGEAERVVAAFGAQEDRNTLCAVWKRAGAAGPRAPAPGSPGAQMALGLDRGCFGDILVGEERAYLFVLKELCAYIAR